MNNLNRRPDEEGCPTCGERPSRGMDQLEQDPLGEDEFDLDGGDDLGGDLGNDLGGLGGEDDLDLDGGSLDDELGGDDMVEVDSETLRQILDDVEAGAKSADEAWEACCGNAEEELGDEMGMGDEIGGEPGLDDLESESMGMGGIASECGGVYEGVDVNRIASMLTDDPDVFDE